VSAPDDGWYRGDPPPTGAPGYPPPGYGPAPYGPPSGYGVPPRYGAPPGYGAPTGYAPLPGHARHRPTNQLALVALVLAFLGPLSPVGLALGIVARRQIHRTGEEGEGLALAAVVIGGVVTTLIAVTVVFWLFVLVSIGNGGFAP
jgi:hypothetical protein